MVRKKYWWLLMDWNQKDLDQARRTVESHLETFGYPYRELETEDLSWSFIVELAGVEIQIAPTPEGELVAVGFRFEAPADLRTILSKLSPSERAGLLDRLKTVCLNKGVQYNLNLDVDKNLDGGMFQQHLVASDLSAQTLLEHLERVKDAYFMLVLVGEIAQRKVEDGGQPKVKSTDPKDRNVVTPQGDDSLGTLKHIQVTDEDVWEDWCDFIEEGERQTEALRRLLSAAG